ncbi:MAG: hypothetical protein ABFD66_14050 [Smithella sp.]
MSVLNWIKYFAVFFVSMFFLIIGVNALIGSYSLKNPIEFVMYFFSSSLLILVCISGLIYFFIRIFSRKQKNETNTHESE